MFATLYFNTEPHDQQNISLYTAQLNHEHYYVLYQYVHGEVFNFNKQAYHNLFEVLVLH